MVLYISEADLSIYILLKNKNEAAVKTTSIIKALKHFAIIKNTLGKIFLIG